MGQKLYTFPVLPVVLRVEVRTQSFDKDFPCRRPLSRGGSVTHISHQIGIDSYVMSCLILLTVIVGSRSFPEATSYCV